MTDYDLGIIWSVGSWDGERFIFRHNSQHHIERLATLFNNTMYEQQGRTGIQYVIKTNRLDKTELEAIGWTSRNSEQRPLPLLVNYRDFLRAYFELHATFGWQTTYKRGTKQKYYRLRMRIFGNRLLLESITNILCVNRLIVKKSVQSVTENSCYIQLTWAKEIENIVSWVDGRPCYEAFWTNANDLLRKPIKEVE